MTAIDNLRSRKLELEHNLREAHSQERRELIESELTKIVIALSFLESGKPLSSQATSN